MKETNNDHFHKHLDILQGIISRMAANSASCKNYCITLVAALLALALGQDEQIPEILYIAFMPVVLFCFLDAYYLSLERYFKIEYNKTVTKWQEESLERKDLFIVESSSKGFWRFLETFSAMTSYSILPFYGSLLAVILLIVYRSNFM
jgi:hypothetical protein